MVYLRRTIDSLLDQMMPYVPAIAIDGAKGVGKTETAKRRVVETWRLDDESMRSVVSADFDLRSAPSGSLLIDEWQNVPQVWNSVRRKVDEGAQPGSFLLTGSASPHDATGTHSGAGRILSVRMRPMALHERGMTNPSVSFNALLSGVGADVVGQTDLTAVEYMQAITASGFPGMMQLPGRVRQQMLDSYLARVIDRDIPENGGQVRSPQALTKWLRAYAAATASTTSYSKLVDTAERHSETMPSKATTARYREHLAQLWLLDPVPGWLPMHNEFSRAAQAPKHYLADPALAARLLGLTARDLVSAQGAHMAGPLFEALATLGVRVMAEAVGGRVNHLRMHDGRREIDLIVNGSEGQVLPIEVKLAANVTDAHVKHLLWLREQMPDQVVDLVVINAGSHAYRRQDGVAVVPLALLGE
ncbi:MAG: DUF4143 domain-containing protein [Actinomycetaceae bacterium]|nr:DUF4143 domain-containing protein [Arcanobacterium sp.]MDD7504601.1 DUF4143 domain-containing protein [Actinomycetaceae bacterium]MDY6143084.1 DUF4143 domain-containing protein [Arcanobacterium sp.]